MHACEVQVKRRWEGTCMCAVAAVAVGGNKMDIKRRSFLFVSEESRDQRAPMSWAKQKPRSEWKLQLFSVAGPRHPQLTPELVVVLMIFSLLRFLYSSVVHSGFLQNRSVALQRRHTMPLSFSPVLNSPLFPPFVRKFCCVLFIYLFSFTAFRFSRLISRVGPAL